MSPGEEILPPIYFRALLPAWWKVFPDDKLDVHLLQPVVVMHDFHWEHSMQFCTSLHKMLYNVTFSKQTGSHTKVVCKNLFVGVFHKVRFPRLKRQPQPWRLCSFSFLGSSVMHFWCQREVHLVVLHVWKGWWEHLLYPSTNLQWCKSFSCCTSNLSWTMEPAALVSCMVIKYLFKNQEAQFWFYYPCLFTNSR